MNKYLKKSTLVFLVLISLVGCQTTAKPVVSDTILALGLIDVHNHDASGKKYLSSFKVWDKYGISKVVLFGDISEQSAQLTDQISLQAAAEYPERIIPFIAGINISDPKCIEYIKDMFEKGALGVGEIIARSLYSPVTSRLEWKAVGVNDPRLHRVYKVCGDYRRPILLHIDPLNRSEIQEIINVSKAFIGTDFIIAHANAYSDIVDIEYLLTSTTNVYLDFFPGFSIYNSDSLYFQRDSESKLPEYTELIEKFPDRFFLSSDSGFGVGYEKAYKAIHTIVLNLRPETAKKIASENFKTIISKATQQPKSGSR